VDEARHTSHRPYWASALARGMVVNLTIACSDFPAVAERSAWKQKGMVMVLRRRRWMAGAITWVLTAGGCGDDASPAQQPDASVTDAGTDAGGVMASPDGGSLTSSTETDGCGSCPNGTSSVIAMSGCCLEDAGTCGLDVKPLADLLPNSDLDGCFARDRDGVASDYCGAVFDQIDGTKDSRLTLVTRTGSLVLSGCCTPDGECGLSLGAADLFVNSIPSQVDLQLGCVGLSEVALALGDTLPLPDVKDLALQPYCDANTGGTLAAGTFPGLPEFVCGCGTDRAYDADQAFFPCVSFAGSDVCGVVKADETALEAVPGFICGCGAGVTSTDGYPCLPNLTKDICGQAATSDTTLALIPEFVCGCGDVPQTNGTCLSFIPPNVCGKLAVDVEVVPGFPVYVCGCGNGEHGTGACIRNVPTEVCGKEPPEGGAIPGWPEYTCGCGEEIRGTGACIPYVSTTTCGAQAVTGGTVPALPEYTCGCGDGVRGDGSCIPNVPLEVCGSVAFTGSAVPSLPEYRCGCGDGQLGNGRCIANVPASVCGAIPVDQGPLTDYPEYFCGCGDGLIGTGKCISNVPSSVCGALAKDIGTVIGWPGTVCGCGDGQLFTSGLPCLNNVPSSVCGEDPAPIDDKATPADPSDDCVSGFPANLLGCGLGTSSNLPITCIPNVAVTLRGCTPV